MDDDDQLSLFEKKMKDLERRATAGDIPEEEMGALMEEIMEEMGSALEEIMEEMGSALEELLAAMMEAMTEGMTEFLGSVFPMRTVQIPTEEEVLSIAKKCYYEHKKLIPKKERKDFSREVGKVNFDGMLYDTPRANGLCKKALALGICSKAVAAAAAAVGWSPADDRGADTLARILDDASFIDDEDRSRDAEILSRYAVSVRHRDPDLYITLARILHRRGDTDGALDALDDALDRRPGHKAATKLKKEIEKERYGSFL